MTYSPTIEECIRRVESLIRLGINDKNRLQQVTQLSFYQLDRITKALKHEGRITEPQKDTYSITQQMKFKKHR